MKQKLLHRFGYLISISLFVLALLVIHHKLKAYHYHDIASQLRQMPVRALLLAAALTVIDYLVLTVYDALALLYIRHSLPYRRIALASFIGYVFNHNTTIVGGSAARYRIYSAFGISAAEVAKLVIFCSLTFWLGFFAIGGIVFVAEPQEIPAAFHTPFGSVLPIGIVFLVFVAAYMLVIAIRKQPMRFHDWEFAIPTIPVSVGQIAISSLDWMLAGGVLYVLLPASMGLTFTEFLAIFLFAQVAGLLSSIPGGLGVFEGVILLLLSGFGEGHVIIGCLLVYRLIYYILPLGVASVLLAVYEVLAKTEHLKRFVAAFGRWSSAVTPNILSFSVLIAGAVLLFSGALPAIKGRLTILRDFLPLPAIEVSHFLGSLAGAGLLILARGLQRRLDAAYHFAVGLLAAGIVLSLMKGLDYEEATILAIMLIALLPCRGEFRRKASLITQRFSTLWIGLIVIVLLCSAWLVFFSYKHIEYSNQLWWQFAVHSNAPRSLRGTTAAIVAIFLYGVIKLLRPAAPAPVVGSKADIEKARPVVKTSKETYSNLALLGDKAFLFNDEQNTFIMYGVEGRSWVALGNPVGPESEWDELIWRFRELADRYACWPVFYEVSGKNLDGYLDLGLSFLKLGEEARVHLPDFSLEGSKHSGLRHSHNKIENEGCTFEIIAADAVPSVFAELKNVSDRWLEEKNTREKGFSLGFFDEEYLKQFPLAVVRRGGAIVAFANIWPGAEKEELSIDLMRYLPELAGLMDYLFIEILLWGKRQQYEWFNLGMAPLSGFEDRALAPLWHKLGTFVFRHGEHFYNFQGLRQYKEKFSPQWQPKYLVCPGGLAVPTILVNISSLVSRGLKGVIAK
jgi:phosphatidylglycerol lysyltransferase